jgi:hypothetical protein
MFALACGHTGIKLVNLAIEPSFVGLQRFEIYHPPPCRKSQAPPEHSLRLDWVQPPNRVRQPTAFIANVPTDATNGRSIAWLRLSDRT